MAREREKIVRESDGGRDTYTETEKKTSSDRRTFTRREQRASCGERDDLLEELREREECVVIAFSGAFRTQQTEDNNHLLR